MRKIEQRNKMTLHVLIMITVCPDLDIFYSRIDPSANSHSDTHCAATAAGQSAVSPLEGVRTAVSFRPALGYTPFALPPLPVAPLLYLSRVSPVCLLYSTHVGTPLTRKSTVF
jgi:hypothetical protein